MGDDFDFTGFVRVDYRLFGSHEAWNDREAAFARWQAAAINVAPEKRLGLFDYPVIKWVPLMRAGAPHERSRWDVPTKEQESAAKDCKAAEARLAKSALVQIEAGAVLVVLEVEKDLQSKPFALAVHRLKELRFGGTHAMYEGKKYLYFLRDCVGKPLDQALHIYGNQKLVEELRELVIMGAPDCLGQARSLVTPMSDIERTDKAKARFHEIKRALKAELLAKLRAGELVAHEGGAVVPREWWQGVDELAELSTWRPGALVRKTTKAERENVQAKPKSVPLKRGRHGYNDADAAALDCIEQDVAAGLTQTAAIDRQLSKVPGASDGAKQERLELKLRERRKAAAGKGS